MNIEAMKLAFFARGGSVTRVPAGRRALRESYVADMAHGADDDRRTALERLADSLERKAARRAKRKARREALA